MQRLTFKYRSYTPIPFLIIIVVVAEPTLPSLVIGLLIVIVGESVRFWGVSIAGSETRTTRMVGGSHLVTSGPFAYVRNPLYVGNIMVYVGIGVMSMALFPWLLIIACLWFYVQYRLIVAWEEEFLLQRFGAEFADYQKHVRRFLPRMTKYVPSAPAPRTMNAQIGLTSERRTLQAIALVTLMVVTVYVVQHWQL
ncbi:MAG: isoprenylcysteine carboxylmethyltransferase family protein [Ignavibacteria bacterium]|nr:isoprenylcysteine carboxylmethyltransferase family protein [Ignavibacteria bacterium]